MGRTASPAVRVGPVEEAASIVQAGGVVVLPTDTCLGLAADACAREAVERVYRIKGRDRPTAVFVPGVEDVPRLAQVDPRVRGVLLRLFPGPWTVLLEALPQTPAWLVSPEGLVGIRCVSFPTVVRLLTLSARLLTATSANLTGHPPAYDLMQLERVLPLHHVDLVVEGPCGGAPPSTVIDLTVDPFAVRRGYVPDYVLSLLEQEK